MIYSTYTVTTLFHRLTHISPSDVAECVTPIDITQMFLSCTDEQMSPPRWIDILFNQALQLGMRLEATNDYSNFPLEVMYAVANLYYQYTNNLREGETGLSLLIILQKTDPTTSVIYYRDVFVYVTTNICAYCMETKSQYETPRFLKCSRCKQVRYCSQECQTKHWHTHKKGCNVLNDMRMSIKETEQPLKYFFPPNIDYFVRNMPSGSLLISTVVINPKK